MKKRKLICVVTLMVLLLNLSMVAFAGDDAGTARPDSIPLPIESQEPIMGFCGDDAGTARPD